MVDWGFAQNELLEKQGIDTKEENGEKATINPPPQNVFKFIVHWPIKFDPNFQNEIGDKSIDYYVKADP